MAENPYVEIPGYTDGKTDSDTHTDTSKLPLTFLQLTATNFAVNITTTKTTKIQKKQCRIRTVTAPNFSQIGQKLRSGIAKSFPHPTIYLLPEFEVNWPKND